MSGTGSSVFDITQSLGADDAGRIKRLLEGGVKIPEIGRASCREIV